MRTYAKISSMDFICTEIERNRKGVAGGSEGERDQENNHHTVDLEAPHWSFLTLIFLVVGSQSLLEVPLPFYTGQSVGIHGCSQMFP